MQDESARRPLSEFLDVARANLRDELDRHRRRRFPEDVDKGADYGSIEPVMADADLFGWSSTVAGGGTLTDDDLTNLAACRNGVEHSLDTLPLDARAFFTDLADTATHALAIDWLAKVGQRFRDLEGATIIRWSGVEVALPRLRDDDTLTFEDPAVPFVNLALLDVELDSGHSRVTTYQDNADFGLIVGPAGDPWSVEASPDLRITEDLEAAVGRVEHVEVTMEEGVIAEVALTVADHTLLLLAGEVYKGVFAKYEFCRIDEDVLFFRDASVADHVPWTYPHPAAT